MPDGKQPVRLLNLGPTHWLRTQSVYRSTAALMSADSPGTIVIGTPLHRYLAVGGGQLPEDSVDLAACAQLDIPVTTSPLSAPLTYLDSGAVVVQWIFTGRSPADLGRLLLDGFAGALGSLGMNGVALSGERVMVGERALVEVQTGRVSQAVVAQGDIFLQFDGAVAGQFPGYAERTFLWRELARPTAPEMLVGALLEAFAKVLGRPIERGKPQQAETRLSKQIDLELLQQTADLMHTEMVLDEEH